MVRNLPAKQKSQVQSLDQEDPLEKEMANYSSILAWEIPRTEEPDGTQRSEEILSKVFQLSSCGKSLSGMGTRKKGRKGIKDIKETRAEKLCNRWKRHMAKDQESVRLFLR